jgi:hypothetical protein
MLNVDIRKVTTVLYVYGLGMNGRRVSRADDDVEVLDDLAAS